VGPGNFKTLTAGAEDFHVAHNTYVELAAELGFPGVLLFLAVLGATFHSAERVRRTAAAAGAAIFVQVAHGVEAGLLGYVVSAFFVSVAWQKFLWLLIFLSISLHQIATAQLRQPTVSQKPAANRPAGV
jgi:O-antigen ligase